MPKVFSHLYKVITMNMKYHYVAAPLLLIALVVLYMMASKQPEQRASQPVGTRFIQISRATWGENCNPTIQQMREDRKTQQALVQPNNVLREVSQRCNGHDNCVVSASATQLGSDIFKDNISCGKELSIDYRCESLQKPITLTLKEDSSGSLDCTKEVQPETTKKDQNTEQPQNVEDLFNKTKEVKPTGGVITQP